MGSASGSSHPSRGAATATTGGGSGLPVGRMVGIGVIALLVLAAGAMAAGIGLPSIPEVDPSTPANLWLVFLTGLSVGGLSCLAVQGGLLAALVAQREQQIHSDEAAGPVATTGTASVGAHTAPVVLFLAAKVVAYTLLGGLLGLFGSRVPMSLHGWMMIGAGIFMILTALQLYDVHPSLRRLTFSPPKRIQRLVRRESRSSHAAAPLALGALTVFIPCGVTLAMEFLAIASNDPVRGAAIMLAFTMGTVPIFMLVGVVTSQIGRSSYGLFRPLAAAAVTVVAAVSIVSGARLLGFGPLMAHGQAGSAEMVQAPAADGAVAEGGGGGTASPGGGDVANASAAVQEARIDVTTGAFVPSRIVVRPGVPTRLTLVTNGTRGCIRAFVIPSLGVERMLPATGSEVVDLPPAEAGSTIPFMCSMGMYTGVIEVGGST